MARQQCIILATLLAWVCAQEPSFVKHVALKVQGDHECVRISEYIKPKNGEPCKDYGQCYQHRCGAIARHCSECGAYKGPCMEYGDQRAKRSLGDTSDLLFPSQQDQDMTSSMENFMAIITSRMRRLVEQVRAVVETVPRPESVPVTSVGNLVVHLQAGDKNCTGFVTKVNGKYLIVTAAQCLINFEVQCQSGLQSFGDKFTANLSQGTMEEGFMMYPYSHSWPCFGDYDADVTKVKKGFRSYTVIVTSYSGREYTIPLNSKHAIVPRNYIECQDCRYDYAAIKLEEAMGRSITRGDNPFILSPDKDPMEWTGEEVTQFVTVKSDQKELGKSTDTTFCTISYATAEKMCFKLPMPPNMDHEPELLPGSPLFIPYEKLNGEMEYHSIGIFTGHYGIVNEHLSTDSLTDDGLDTTPEGEYVSLSMKYSKNGAARITQQFYSMLKQLTLDGNVTQTNTEISHARRERFPNVAQPYNVREDLLLCSLGWKDEKHVCTEIDIKLQEGCAYEEGSFKCEPKLESDETISTLLQEVIIPGATKHLSLRGQRLSDDRELAAVLSHLTELTNLALGYNEFEVLSTPLLEKNVELRTLSLQNNKIRRLHGDIFRHNRKLRLINLSNNQIKSLPADLFQKNTVLRYINLEHNAITFLSPKIFMRNVVLDRIYAGHNNITYFPLKLLRYQALLQEFHINNNNVRKLGGHNFAANPKLTKVDLSSNELTKIPRTTFDNNLELKFVNLNYNLLTILPRRLFHNQKKLVLVEASKNPLTEPNATRSYFESLRVPYS